MTLFKIPRHLIEVRTARSSGAGGQHVNKVETKVEIRFHLLSAEWIPQGVRQRVKTQNAGKINKSGQLIISSEKTRSQKQNLELCFEKLESLILKAWKAPKKRIQTKATKSSVEKRIQSKKKLAENKKLRKKPKLD